MGTKEAVKRNQSSMQVLKTLNLLLENNYTMTELIRKLNENEKEPLFNNSVVSKYINTCRFCGFVIPKIHNRYFVTNIPFGIELTPTERDLLDGLHFAVKNTMTTESAVEFEAFLQKLNNYSNKELVRVEPKTQQKAYELFDKAIEEKRKVRLLFRAKAVFECIPLRIVEKKGRISFNVIHDGKEKVIAADRLTGLEIMDKKFEKSDKDAKQEIVFKLKGKLAQVYTLRENEKIVNNSSDELVVANLGENKNALFSRLLRYDKCCEILFPLHYREEMKLLLDEMLSNYGA